MKLHEDKKLFSQAVRATAEQKGLLEVYIEKDYWVTLALHTIFKHPIGRETVFKGGTALSRCYGLIERFSEDIDLIVLRRDGESNNKLKNKIKRISTIVADILPEIEIVGLTNKMGMNRKTAHVYNKVFKGEYGQVRDVVVVESTWLGYHEPFSTKKICSYISEMMLSAGQTELLKKFEMQAFDVSVLDVQRTLCEKIMSLVRFSYTENAIENLRLKIRHTYDIHCILQENTIRDFFYSDAFDKMLLRVAQDDAVSFRNNNQWLIHHPVEALIFSDPERTWNIIKDTYIGQFSKLIYGSIPEEKKILESLLEVVARLNKVKWTININM